MIRFSGRREWMGTGGMRYVDDARMMMACHYEAGRLFSMWWAGIESGSEDMCDAPLNAPSEPIRWDRKHDPVSKVLVAFIIANTSDFAGTAEGNEASRWDGLRRLQLALVSCYAGSVAWAKHRKRSVASCLGHLGARDVETAQDLSVCYFHTWDQTTERAAISRASAIEHATRLIRSPDAWKTVSSLAGTLFGRLHLSADEVDVICSREYGCRPSYSEWESYWPNGFGDLACREAHLSATSSVADRVSHPGGRAMPVPDTRTEGASA